MPFIPCLLFRPRQDAWRMFPLSVSDNDPFGEAAPGRLRCHYRWGDS